MMIGKKMRNDLVHEGHLAKNHFIGHSKNDCANVCEDVLSWIDEFFHAIFDLGIIRNKRFTRNCMYGLNSYTTW
jgi:hypothetical protein